MLLNSILVAGVNTWTTSGPPGGASSVAVDPGNTSVFYSVSSQEAWRSTDKGRSWQSAFLGPGFNDLLYDVAAGPSYTAYVGTCCWEVNLLKSPNAGLGWMQVSTLALAGGLCGGVRILVDPIISNNIYATLGPCGTAPNRPPHGSLLKSVDGGHGFVPITQGLTGLELGGQIRLAVDPIHDEVVYVWTGTGLSKSSDGGSTWSLLFSSPQLNADGITALVVDHLAPMEIYASTRTFGVFKSIDGGLTFSAANNGLLNTFVSDLVIDPKRRGRLYAATKASIDRKPEVFATFDGGVSWRSIDDGLPDLDTIDRLAIDPGGSFLLAATPAGVFEYEFPPDLEPVLPSRARPQPRQVPQRPDK